MRDRHVFMLIGGIFLLILLLGCGAKVENDTTYRVEGEAVVRVEVGIDVSACQTVPEADRAECIETLVIAMSKALEAAGNTVKPIQGETE